MADKINVEKAAKWLNSQWKGPKTCPVCHNNNWTIGEDLVEIRPFQGADFIGFVGGSVLPLFAVTCKICGHTLLFNAIVADLLKLETAGAKSE